MSVWYHLLQHIQQNTEQWLAVLMVIQVIWALVGLTLWSRYRALNRRLHQLTAGASGVSLERVLLDHLARVEAVDTRQNQIEQRIDQLEAQIPHCLQQVGLVRYDAFEDVGGQQSFSLALVDARQTGIVLTSVYTRSDVRVYAKALKEGVPSHPLSDEEKQALREAQGKR